MNGGWRELIGHYKCGCGAIYRKTFTTTSFETDEADVRFAVSGWMAGTIRLASARSN
jgi:hypothetical protein